MRTYLYKVALLTTFGGFVSLSTAQAGFEFTAPIQTGPAQQTQQIPPLSGGLLPNMPTMNTNGQNGSMPAAPTQPVASEPTPIIPQDNNQMAAPAPMNKQTTPRQPQTGLSSLAPSNAAPVQTMPTYQPQPATPSSNNAGQYEMAVGFGQDLPLVTALRQVVPGDYTYVLSDSVPMGQTVSWDGGRPWNQVLNDMIAPLGLDAIIEGQRVMINEMGATPAPQARPQTQTAMAPTYQPPVMNDAAPQSVDPMPMPPAAPAPVVNMDVNAPRSQTQLSAPSPSAAPVSRNVPSVTRGTWTASRGDNLRSVLEDWSDQAGAELFWSSDYNYPLAGDVNISGSFEEAAETLLQGFEQARPKPIARLHPNLPHGPAVLVVETRATLD